MEFIGEILMFGRETFNLVQQITVEVLQQGNLIVNGDFEDPEENPDSRSLGWVPRKNLVGVASTVWWPPTRVRRVKP